MIDFTYCDFLLFRCVVLSVQKHLFKDSKKLAMTNTNAKTSNRKIFYEFKFKILFQVIGSHISQKSTSPGSLSLSQDLFIVIGVDLQLADGVQSLLFP